MAAFRMAGFEPIALLTYETAHASGLVIDLNTPELVQWFNGLVTKYFGADCIDNKITICCTNGSGDMLFITYWDRTITVGSVATIYNDFRKPHLNYMCRRALYMTKFSPTDTIDHLLSHWKRAVFPQPISITSRKKVIF